MESPSHSSFRLLHEIFVLDAHLREPLDESRAAEITRKLVDALLAALHMEELGALQVYPAVDLRAPGWSFIQPITTSHISGHYFREPNRQPHIRMDFYSCSCINWMDIIRIVHKNLDLADWRGTFIDRQIKPHTLRRMLEVAGEGDRVLFEAPLQLHDPLAQAKEAKVQEAVNTAR